MDNDTENTNNNEPISTSAEEQQDDLLEQTSNIQEETNLTQSEWEKELDAANESIKSNRQKELTALVIKLKKELPAQSGLQQEFNQHLIDTFEEMLVRSESDLTFDSLTKKINSVTERHPEIKERADRLAQAVGGYDNLLDPEAPYDLNIRANLDYLGTILGYMGDVSTRITDEYATKLKAYWDAAFNMGSTRAINKIAEKLGEENCETINTYAVKVNEWSEENLNPGEREVVSVAMTAITRGVFNATGGKIKSAIKANKLISRSSKSRKKGTELFAGLTAEKATKIKAKHRAITESHVNNLIKNGTITLTADIPAEQQVKKIVDKAQKSFLKYQNWNNIVGNEHKLKIVRSPQHTGTQHHARAMALKALEYAKQDDVSLVFMDQGIKKISGINIQPNRRSDITVVYKSGRIKLIEVASKTDKRLDLQARLDKASKALPQSMRGGTEVLEIEDVMNRGK